MLIDEPDDSLRRIVFGRGSSDEEVKAASAELDRRSRSQGADSSRQVTGSERADADDERGDEAEPNGGEVVAPPRRPSWLTVGALAVVAAGLGVFGSAVYFTASAPTSTEAEPPAVEEPTPSFVSSVADPRTGETLYQIPDSAYPVSAGDGERWFAGPQTGADALFVNVDSIDPSSSRFISEFGELGRLWIARGVDGDYCVLSQVAGGGGGSSCANSDVFAEAGIYYGTDGYSVFWNRSSIIMSKTPPQ